MALSLTWDESIKKLFETGLDRGVLYPRDAVGAYPAGVAWTGLTSVSESPGGAEVTDLYASNVKYTGLVAPETFGATLECFTYPNEFAACDGSEELEVGVAMAQQERQVFGLSYRTKIGSDAGGIDLGYKIHLVYGCLVTPSEVGRTTINESPEAITFSYELTTTPVAVADFRPTSKLVIDSTKIDPADLLLIEEELYGTVPNLPLPDEILALITV